MQMIQTRVITESVEIPHNLTEFTEWSFGSGSTTGLDFKEFARMFRAHIIKALKNTDINLVKFSIGHYYISGFATNGKKYAYFSIPDVRFFPGEWFENILIRTARNDHDYTGGANHYISLDNIVKSLGAILADDFE